MANNRKVVKVFLASPGDLSEERKAAKSVTDDFNEQLAEEFGYQVELVGWEDTVSVFGRPQATINRELERCELFVGMMWQRWGTSPDTKGPYTSGFEEEYRISVARRLHEGRPEISLLFKEIDEIFLRDPGDELKKVIEFKRQIVAEKNILFEKFSDIREFEKKFRRCITQYVINLKTQEANKVVGQSIAPTTGGDLQNAAETTSSAPSSLLSPQGTQFIRNFITKTERPPEQVSITAVEIARFRLLGTLVGSYENDERNIEVHDANLLFTKGHDFEFGRRELVGLVISGLVHYANENVPLWYWLAAINGFERQVLPRFSIAGQKDGHVGALEAMRLISEPFPTAQNWNRERCLSSWFDKDAPSALKVAALGYLGDCGNASDLEIIRQQLTGNDNQVINAATDAIIRINLRDSREKAIHALYELQSTSINVNLLEELFDNEASLSIKIFLDGVNHPNSYVRAIVTNVLRRRRAMPNEMAEQLLRDSDADVRYEALQSLVSAGRTFSDAEAKAILVKETTSGGLRGLFATSDSSGETNWIRFRRERLRALKDKELEEAANEDPMLDRDPQFILAERHFRRYGEGLRKSVDDQYKSAFSQALTTLAEKFPGRSDLVDKLRSIEDFVRKDLTRQGLDVICRKNDPSDLERVRMTLESKFVDCSDSDVEYLRRFGEWKDIHLIFDCIDHPGLGHASSLLMGFDDSKNRTAARAVYGLGRTRLSELLALPMPARLLPQLIVEIPDKAFHSLNDVVITMLLRSANETARKAAALKCVRALPKSRLAKLLADYATSDQHYYNVIHWLDFGVSAPRNRVAKAVEKVINKQWRS